VFRLGTPIQTTLLAFMFLQSAWWWRATRLITVFTSTSRNSSVDTRNEWISALDIIESLKPCAVVAGHKKPRSEDSPRIVEETRQYIRDFNRITAATTTAEELYNRMLALYPDRLNPGALWSSARGVKN
jgi:DNA-binding helix-hairpin-helix protein with protein kinase domain